MLFQSVEFLCFFLPTILVGYAMLRRWGSRRNLNLFLTLGSLFFYGYWKPAYLPLLVLSIVFNFYMGHYLRIRGTRRSLVFGITMNFVVLFFYKYFDFVASNFWGLIGHSYEPLGLILPLGISFFTFQNIMFLVDSFEREAAEPSLLHYFVFLSFFPHLIAGPLLVHSEIIPQFKEEKKYDWNMFWVGVLTFAIGFVKKVGIADTFALWANEGFRNALTLHWFEGWATSLSYTFQLYFDFSGYSDMAIGLGLLFNIRIPQNFDSPFKSSSLIEFWSRWHMTLTRMINAYFYWPLIRRLPSLTFGRMMLITVLTMVVVGLWHGANWTFIAFGALHGIGLVVNHVAKKFELRMPRMVGWALTFMFVNFSFVIFRSPQLGDAWSIWQAMLGFKGVVLDPTLFGRFSSLQEYGIVFGDWFHAVGELDRKFVLAAIATFCVVTFGRNSLQLAEGFRFRWIDMLRLSMTLVLVINLSFAKSSPSDFLYFNF